MRKQRYDFLEWAKSKSPDDTLAHSNVSEATIYQAVNAAYSSTKFQDLLQEDNQWGLESLKSAIARRYGITDSKDEPRVLLTPGASNAIYLVCKTFLSVDDEVIIESPFYEPVRLAAEETKARVILWPRKGGDFSIDIDSLASLITENTKLIVLSNFHNPSGNGATRDELIRVADVARKNQIKVVVDEIYLDIAKDTSGKTTTSPVFAEGKISSAAQLGDELLISINSLSKVYGLSRIRSGWIMGASKVIWTLRKSYKVAVNIGCLDTEAVSAIIFDGLDNYTSLSQDVVRKNREIMQAELSNLIDGNILSGKIPEYGCTYFPKLAWLDSLTDSDADNMIDALDKECGVVPGGFFGETYHNHIRIGLGGSSDKFYIAIRNLKQKLETLHRDRHP